MLQVIGAGARKLEDGIEVTAEIQTDDGTLVERVTIKGPDLDNIKEQLQNLLAARQRAEQDATLAAAVVGQQLAAI